MGLLSDIISNPTIGKMVFKFLKRKALKSLDTPLEKTLEKQSGMLELKFKRMEETEIGRKLGIHRKVRLQDIPMTDYGFYESFLNNPTSSAFMYNLEDYIRVRTSGTSGKEKWFMLPQEELKRAIFETLIPVIFIVFHDGEKSTLKYGDSFYLNAAPRPFLTGYMASKVPRSGFINIVPNINLSYHDKVRYFILNYRKIDGAVMLASTLISQIMPSIGKPIQLKGLALFDAQIAEVYRKELQEFTGAIPKSTYFGTETFLCSLPSVQCPLGFMFDWHRGVFEFLPIRNGEVEKESIEVDQVNVGEIYQLVYTSAISELTRYNLKDCVKCVAKGDDILGVDYPIFKFHSRLEKTISLQNFTRISEDELIIAFTETGIPFIDFTARVEMEKGLEYLAVYIEHTGDMSAEEIQKVIHKQLYEIDRDYRDLVDFFGYIPLRIHLVTKGVFSKYLEGKISAVPKVDRINMREEEFKMILKLMKGL